jgi:hypothetical protein
LRVWLYQRASSPKWRSPTRQLSAMTSTPAPGALHEFEYTWFGHESRCPEYCFLARMTS